MKEAFRKFILQTAGKRKYGMIVVSLVLVAAVWLWYRGEVENTGILKHIGIPDSTSPSSFTIVIDPGHGGISNRPKKGISIEKA